GAQSPTFQVGTASNYNPVTVAFGNVSGAGDLTAKATAGEHPNIASSAINSSKDVNVYWTLTTPDITFDSYSVTFTFVSGDVDGGANTGAFVVGRYSSGWYYPTVGTRTSTSTQATGVTSLSVFAVGETVTWVSYSDAGRTVEENNFVDPYRTVYMGGTGFTVSHSYHVGYYDGVDVLVLSEGVASDGSGNLQSMCNFENIGALAGTWHSVIYDDLVASPPSDYVSSDPESVFEDAFTVNISAIPEFPTIIAMISVTALCGAIYYWMRRRRVRA
ncbi:hypothetical protein ACFLTS_06775, partial [Chloroflexota bacterium]